MTMEHTLAEQLLPMESVVMRITRDLNTGKILEDLFVNPSQQQYNYATIFGVPRDILTIWHYPVDFCTA